MKRRSAAGKINGWNDCAWLLIFRSETEAVLRFLFSQAEKYILLNVLSRQRIMLIRVHGTSKGFNKDETMAAEVNPT